MIWNLVSENVVSEQVYEDHVKLTVKELTVRVSESKPDGRYNQVFSPNQFNRYANSNNNRNNNYNEDEKQDRYLSSGKKTRARNFGRGQAVNLH